jgi:hypothetical protein
MAAKLHFSEASLAEQVLSKPYFSFLSFLDFPSPPLCFSFHPQSLSQLKNMQAFGDGTGAVLCHETEG